MSDGMLENAQNWLACDNSSMLWQLSSRADPIAREIADRHYNRQKIGAPQFAPPGKTLVFVIGNPATALWISSAPIAEYVRHEWAGTWMCTCFRNESTVLSSELIRYACMATKYIWGDPPDLGMVTFVDPTKVRKKRDFGRCYRKAGWHVVGKTKKDLIALQLLPSDWPATTPPLLPRSGLNTKYKKILIELMSKENMK